MESYNCKKCKYSEIIHAQGGFKFTGCKHKPYKGKWVTHIDDVRRRKN